MAVSFGLVINLGLIAAALLVFFGLLLAGVVMAIVLKII
jgi:hypothetical protein